MFHNVNFDFFQDVGQQQAVQLSDEEQLDCSVSAGVDADAGGGDGDIDPTIADEQMDSAVAQSDGEGDDRDTNIPTEPTVSRTRSGSKLVPENTPPL